MKRIEGIPEIWQRGDRVRVTASRSPYTGCRGTVVEAPGSADGDQLPLGYYVAIDGENGVAQPFLTGALERIAAASSRRRPEAPATVAAGELGKGRIPLPDRAPERDV